MEQKPFKQERQTHEDTLKAQNDLRAFITLKIKYPFIAEREKTIFPSLLAKALLSSGTSHPIIPRIKLIIKQQNREHVVIKELGQNQHHFALRLMYMKVTQRPDGAYVTHLDGIELKASRLWTYLNDLCERSYAHALAEAIHMSKEIPKQAYTEPGYGFESGKVEE